MGRASRRSGGPPPPDEPQHPHPQPEAGPRLQLRGPPGLGAPAPRGRKGGQGGRGGRAERVVRHYARGGADRAGGAPPPQVVMPVAADSWRPPPPPRRREERRVTVRVEEATNRVVRVVLPVAGGSAEAGRPRKAKKKGKGKRQALLPRDGNAGHAPAGPPAGKGAPPQPQPKPKPKRAPAADRSERVARGEVVRQANDLADRLLTKLDAAMQDKQSAEELVVSLLQEKSLMKSSLQETEREKGNLQEQLVFIESQQDLFNQSFNRISDENYQ